MCTSCHNEPLDFPDCRISKNWNAGASLQNSSTFLPSLASLTIHTHQILSFWSEYFALMKSLRIKFQSSFSGIAISDVDKNPTAEWMLTFHYRFSASAVEMTKASVEIHHGGPAAKDSSKCGHVRVKGQVWHWPSDAAVKSAELAAVITPLPAQPVKCHICPCQWMSHQ